MEKTTTDNVIDSRLTTFLQKELSERKIKDKRLKKSQYCGCQRAIALSPAVFLVTNDKKSHFYGLARCHSSWGCPTCTPKRMAEYGTRIAAAIDALKKQYKSSAFMLTLTIPHRRWMSIEDTYEILQNSWRQFSKSRKATVKHKYTLKTNTTEDKRGVGQKGEERTYTVNKSAVFAQLCEQFQIKHSVRVYEFTWSKLNGWHPHIHALLWTPDKLFDKLNDGWQQKIADDWWEIARKETIKFYAKKFPDQREKTLLVVNSLYSEHKKEIYQGAYISVDKNNKVLRVSSSHYISGWGGDSEVSNERKMKRAQEGHYSPYQILNEAYQKPNERDYWFNLYVDFLKVTYGRRRVQFSNSGINQIAANWMLTNQWIEVVKKKLTAKATDNWKMVCWFSDEQWSAISMSHLQTQILERARLPDARKQIKDLLEQHNIKLLKKNYTHWYQQTLENVLKPNDIYERQAQNLKDRTAAAI